MSVGPTPVRVQQCDTCAEYALATAPGQKPCPSCDGGRGWSPHQACPTCGDTGSVPQSVSAPAWQSPCRIDSRLRHEPIQDAAVADFGTTA